MAKDSCDEQGLSYNVHLIAIYNQLLECDNALWVRVHIGELYLLSTGKSYHTLEGY